MDKAEVRDSTILTVRYHMEYRSDPDSDRKSHNAMILQVGKNRSKYYSLVREDRDVDAARIAASHNSKEGSNPVWQPKRDPAGSSNMNGEIWIDFTRRILTERYHSLRRYNESVEYEEPVPAFEWTLHPDTMTRCNHLCMKASTRFRGREWIVWYAPEIPVSAGPWKFGGLPGLILHAEDTTGAFIWECEAITAAPEPMIYYHTDVTRTTREQYRKYLNNFHARPLQTLSEGERVIVRSKGHVLDESWQIPYNPIELE